MSAESQQTWMPPSGPRMAWDDAKADEPSELAAMPGSVTLYRLVLSHPGWPRDTRTKWQESPDFTKAIAKAKELGVTARVESQNAPDEIPTGRGGHG